jgi:hypothetical protein
MMVLPVMARATRHLGLGATQSTTFFNPYHLARTLAALDLERRDLDHGSRGAQFRHRRTACEGAAL